MIKKIDIIKLYKNSGIKKGDNIFCHSDLTRFSNINFPVNQLCKTILKSIKKQIGNSGTLAVPVFTYSFCKNEVFDPNKIKSNTGAFSNYVLNLPESRVYEDPNLAIAIIGKNKNFLAKNPQINSYGDNAIIFTLTPLYQQNDNLEQFIKVNHMREMKIVTEIATKLYYNPEEKRLIPGVFKVQKKVKPGSFSRLKDKISHFSKVMNLWEMDAIDVIKILPKEFDIYK